MRWISIGVAALALAVAYGGTSAGAAAIKTGRWRFTAQLEAPAAAPVPWGTKMPAAPRASGGGLKATYTSCIASDKAVPAEFGPQCKLDGTHRHGRRITWSMICTNRQNKVRSDGVAQYHGDTMEATMVSRLPGAGGKVTDMIQHITGRYLGPCLQPADLPMTPSQPNPPTASEAVLEPPAASAGTTPSSGPGSAAAIAPAEPLPPRRRHYARRRHYRHYRYYGGWFGSSVPYEGGFGPAPYSNNGP
jgi:Protein of unknown function (DUF3617)